jgi:hypothetical protein
VPCLSGEVQSHLQVPPGFQAAFDPTWAAYGGLEVLPDGGVVLFDGLNVVLQDPQGGEARTLYTPEPGTTPQGGPFGTFLRFSPGRKSLFFGVNYPSADSSPHEIFNIPLDGAPSDVRAVDTIRFNYDLAFDDQGRGFVSSYDWGAENRIFLLDGDPGAPSKSVVAGIYGPSGPLAFHGGRLYYATASREGVNRIVYFNADEIGAAIAGDQPIEFQSAIDRGQILLDNAVSSFSNLVFAGDALFASGSGKIFHICLDGSLDTFGTVLPGQEGGFSWASYLAFRPGPKGFTAGAGSAGGVLYASISDFSTFNGVTAIVPETWFRRGYVNGDADLHISDALSLLGFLFLGDPGPDPLSAGDLNDDGDLDLSDAIFLLTYLFGGGPQPPEPFQAPGPDPTR